MCVSYRDQGNPIGSDILVYMGQAGQLGKGWIPRSSYGKTAGQCPTWLEKCAMCADGNDWEKGSMPP